ncbi:MAG: universal stress protein [Candidatus Nitrosocosmicus sp.]|uniref:universal stress protein n=1 Tax=Candidatus Nitrosocosmicus sp. FF01 TaxID=3397670 RepID=UPI0039E8DDC9
MNLRILAPVDGSENSMRALDHALLLSSKLDSKLTILYVLEIPPFVYIQSQKLVNSIMLELEKEAKEILENCLKRAKDYELEIETTILEGQNVGSIIIDYIEKNNFNYIVIGSRGKGKFKHAILGSVSHRVLHHSKVPVLVVK